MTGNKKVRCNACYREMRSDNVKRHMKQHTKKNESNPVTNISVTNNYNTISGVSTERKDEENENKDLQTPIHKLSINHHNVWCLWWLWCISEITTLCGDLARDPVYIQLH